jgi:FixJ family two-component response regulator
VQEPEKPFDSVRLMRELRDQIDRDVQNMTEEQRDEYIRRRAQRFWTQLAEKEQRAGVAVSH